MLLPYLNKSHEAEANEVLVQEISTECTLFPQLWKYVDPVLRAVASTHCPPRFNSLICSALPIDEGMVTSCRVCVFTSHYLLHYFHVAIFGTPVGPYTHWTPISLLHGRQEVSSNQSRVIVCVVSFQPEYTSRKPINTSVNSYPIRLKFVVSIKMPSPVWSSASVTASTQAPSTTNRDAICVQDVQQQTNGFLANYESATGAHIVHP